MSRIRKGYEARFRALLRELNVRRLEPGVQWWLARAEAEACQGRVSESDALAQMHTRLFEKILRYRMRRASRAGSESSAGTPAAKPSLTLLCDAGLGGLARWLRAIGYEAVWNPRLNDDDLLREAQRLGATLLTTDSMLMERRVLRDGMIRAVWLPPTLRLEDQLALVGRELGLTVQPARCMSCGGILRPVAKAAVSDRIPPKTRRWREDYFVCVRCDKLFWHGTHWERIQHRLHALGLIPIPGEPSAAEKP